MGCCDDRLNPPNTPQSDTPNAWLSLGSPPLGSVGDSYDNALAESIIGLFTA
jgi:hypothetical protein